MNSDNRTPRQGVLVTAFTVLIAVVIAVAALGPPRGISLGNDKIYHFAAFAALAFPLSLMKPHHGVWIALGVCGYGGFIEVIQPMFGRQAELLDLVADALGAATGALAGYATAHLFRSETAPARPGQNSKP